MRPPSPDWWRPCFDTAILPNLDTIERLDASGRLPLVEWSRTTGAASVRGVHQEAVPLPWEGCVDDRLRVVVHFADDGRALLLYRWPEGAWTLGHEVSSAAWSN